MRRQLVRRAPTELRRLSDTSKAAVFSAMLLTLALTAALVIRALDPPQVLAYIIWGLDTPGRGPDHDAPDHRCRPYA